MPLSAKESGQILHNDIENEVKIVSFEEFYFIIKSFSILMIVFSKYIAK